MLLSITSNSFDSFSFYFYVLCTSLNWSLTFFVSLFFIFCFIRVFIRNLLRGMKRSVSVAVFIIYFLFLFLIPFHIHLLYLFISSLWCADIASSWFRSIYDRLVAVRQSETDMKTEQKICQIYAAHRDRAPIISIYQPKNTK